MSGWTWTAGASVVVFGFFARGVAGFAFGLATDLTTLALALGAAFFATFTGTGRFFRLGFTVAFRRFVEAAGFVFFAGAFFAFSAAHRLF